MTRPRATTSQSDALGAVLADLKARLAKLEIVAHQHNTPISQLQPVGTVLDYVGSSAPSGWALLNGQTLTNAQTLFPTLWAVAPTGWRSGSNLILPDLRGRTTIGAGQGSGLTNRALGASGGAETHTLTIAQMPSHRHDTRERPDLTFFGTAGDGSYSIASGTAISTQGPTSFVGGGGAHNNMQPFYALNKILKVV